MSELARILVRDLGSYRAALAYAERIAAANGKDAAQYQTAAQELRARIIEKERER